MTSFSSKKHHHTIVSTQIIKPFSPTPPHLKTYNLSVYDQIIPNTFSPMLLFYPNTGIYHDSHDQMLDLKNSLSHTLTKYYPFAGRHAKIAPTFVDCNDHGADFIEAYTDSTLLDFFQNTQNEDLDKLFPYDRTWNYSNRTGHDLQSDNVIPLAIKVTRFQCNGLAVAVSLSHKIADAYSLIRFITDWAKMNSNNMTYEDPIEPHFISFQNTNISFTRSLQVSNDCVTRRFVFPNAKILALKHKVNAMSERSGQHITNPTRVEVVTWLLYKCAVRAATNNNLGSFNPICIRLATNLRDKMIEPLPENSIGNFLMGLEVQTRNQKELNPQAFIGQLRNQKMKIYGIKNIKAVFDPLLSTSSNVHLQDQRKRKFENTYVFSSICGYPTNLIDFGWGSSIKVTVPGNLMKNSFVFMDAPNGEGIEVLACLEKQDMDLIEGDSELLAFANICLGLAQPFLSLKPKPKLRGFSKI
ncbi:hypothetical protein R6Q59_013509 [Mikania micrantha]